MAGLLSPINYEKPKKFEVPNEFKGIPGLENLQTGFDLLNAKTQERHDKVADPFGYTNPNEGQDMPEDGYLSRENPIPGQSYFPTVTRDLVNEQADRGADYFEGALNYGTDPYFAVNSSDPMTQALEQTSGKYFSGDILKSGAKAKSKGMAVDQTARAVDQAAAIRENEVNNFNQQKQYEQQRYALYKQWERAKAAAEQSLMGAIFSGLGTLGGAALGFIMGGPIGAGVGAGIGNKVGSTGAQIAK